MDEVLSLDGGPELNLMITLYSVKLQPNSNDLTWANYRLYTKYGRSYSDIAHWFMNFSSEVLISAFWPQTSLLGVKSECI